MRLWMQTQKIFYVTLMCLGAWTVSPLAVAHAEDMSGVYDFGSGGRPDPSIDKILIQEKECASWHRKPARCPAQRPVLRVEMIQQLSSAPCFFGQTWGYDPLGVWVTQGCRALFRLHEQGPRIPYVRMPILRDGPQ